MKTMLSRSMTCHDELVVEFSYRDVKGQKTRRVVSPIRFLGGDRFLGLCLSREEPRQFYLDRCDQMELKQACDYVMPVQLVSV
ncbi:MAG: hypothetical protein AAFN77_02890 [Planctomycetota bacterium]